MRRTAFREAFVCVARRGHPLLQGESLSLEQYVELQHVQVLPRDVTMYGDVILRSPRSGWCARLRFGSRTSSPWAV